MLPEIQEDKLRVAYALLASLGCVFLDATASDAIYNVFPFSPFRPLVAYGHTADTFVQPAFLTLEAITKLFNKDAHRCVHVFRRMLLPSDA